VTLGRTEACKVGQDRCWGYKGNLGSANDAELKNIGLLDDCCYIGRNLCCGWNVLVWMVKTLLCEGSDVVGRTEVVGGSMVDLEKNYWQRL